MPSIAERRDAFRRLHEAGCFVMPNPWNLGTAHYLQGLGFKALATTSSGCAHAHGYADGAVPRDMVLRHLRDIVESSDLPVNADFEGGYASAPADVAENVRLGVETGVAGISIEDSTGDPANPLYDFDLAVARVRAAREAINKAGGKVVFTARSEGFIVGRPDLDETIRRLKAFSDLGADCLYPPGIRTREHITAVVNALAPKPINLLVSTNAFTVAEIAAMGVRRISIGGTLARVAWTAVMRSARQIAESGRFDSFAGVLSNAELNALFRNDRGR